MFDLSQIEFGKNFSWFLGVVEDPNDPNFLGRVRVCVVSDIMQKIETCYQQKILLGQWLCNQSTLQHRQRLVKVQQVLSDGSWVVGFFWMVERHNNH